MSNETRVQPKPFQYIVGDVVRSVSDGPKMTVARIEPPYMVVCMWFDVINTTGGKIQYGELRTGSFPVFCLKLADAT